MTTTNKTLTKDEIELILEAPEALRTNRYTTERTRQVNIPVTRGELALIVEALEALKTNDYTSEKMREGLILKWKDEATHDASGDFA